MSTTIRDELRSAICTEAARARLRRMTGEEQAAMTAAATEAREARYLERLKKIVDPGEIYSDAERTRKAIHLREERRAKYRADKLRREREQQLKQVVDEEEIAYLEAQAS